MDEHILQLLREHPKNEATEEEILAHVRRVHSSSVSAAEVQQAIMGLVSRKKLIRFGRVEGGENKHLVFLPATSRSGG